MKLMYALPLFLLSSSVSAQAPEKTTVQVGLSVTDVYAVTGTPNYGSLDILFERPVFKWYTVTFGIRKEGFRHTGDGVFLDTSLRYHRALPFGIRSFVGGGATYGVVNDAYTGIEYTADENFQRTWHRWRYVSSQAGLPFAGPDNALERGATFYPFIGGGLSRKIIGPLSIHGELRLGIVPIGIQEVQWNYDTGTYDVLRDHHGRDIMPIWRIAIGYEF